MAEKRRNSAFWYRLAMGLLFAIVVIYTAYHLFSLFFSDDVSTIVSGVTTERVTVGGDGYVFRDETLLYSRNSGVVDYFVRDGEKVSSGQALANVYQSGDGSSDRAMIALLDEQIALLEECSGDNVSASDLSALRKSASDTYFTLTGLLASGEAGELDYQIEKMMLTLSKISVITSGDASIKESLTALKAERNRILSGEYEAVFSTKSGYFYSSTDGYEADFTLSAAEALDGEGFYELIASASEKSENKSDGVYGKLAPNSKWILMLPLSIADAEGLGEGETYNVNFPENNNTTIPMTVERKVASEKTREIIVSLSTNRLPDNFVLERCMTAQIERSSVSGIYVPRSALVRHEGENGVYILRGSVVRFRRIDIIYQGDDYFLVAERDDKDGDYYYLGSNELIITDGNNLFDGRILD